MTAAKYNIICEQGTDFTKQILLKDTAGDAIPLTDYTARMQVRNKKGGDLVVELTTENTYITITALEGLIVLSLPNEITATLPPVDIHLPVKTVLDNVDCGEIPSASTGPTGVYDLEIVDADGKVTRLIEGDFCIPLEVTT